MNFQNSIPIEDQAGRIAACASFASSLNHGGAHGAERSASRLVTKGRFRLQAIPVSIALAAVLAHAASAQEYELDTNALTQVLESAGQWAGENLDEEWLSALEQIDRERVEQFFGDFQKSLRGDQVLDLAAVKTAAIAMLPLLEAHEETQPYAAWLKSRLDFLEVAEELRRAAPPAKLVPGQPPKPPENPPPAAERKVWKQKLVDRPWPKGATELVPKLKPIFASERVPSELVWLAEVESGFNRRARSPAGAAGLFQLMPATAKRFGLRSWPRDQRYQPEPSARAAAQYLRALYGQFGNWPLALAAYNAGEGAVQRLLDRHKTRSFDRIATRLPAETQLFVPKVEATVLRREGVALARLKARGG